MEQIPQSQLVRIDVAGMLSITFSEINPFKICINNFSWLSLFCIYVLTSDCLFKDSSVGSAPNDKSFVSLGPLSGKHMLCQSLNK